MLGTVDFLLLADQFVRVVGLLAHAQTVPCRFQRRLKPFPRRMPGSSMVTSHFIVSESVRVKRSSV